MSNLNNVMREFKAFILKGNIIDMAVGVIIGGAFSKIVTSLVNDILMPVLGALTGGASFNTLKYVINPAVWENGEKVKEEAAILYGSFLQRRRKRRRPLHRPVPPRKSFWLRSATC